jgi:phosphonate transport system ATP-binding protein
MNPQTGAAIRLQDLSKVFDDGTQALKAISFNIEPGTFCVLLGPSGSGKSTLLRCINGLETPSSGLVLFNDEHVHAKSLGRLRKQMGTIHQHFGLVGRDSVANNVLAGTLPEIPVLKALLGWFPKRFQARAAVLLQEAGLQPIHLHRRVSDLSGGQQQRVGIARAFMLSPRLILADEPVASLDPKISADILALIARQARLVGATVLCSLHQIDLAKSVADRIIGLKCGAVVFDGPPHTLTSDVIERLYGSTTPDAPVEAA